MICQIANLLTITGDCLSVRLNALHQTEKGLVVQNETQPFFFLNFKPRITFQQLLSSMRLLCFSADVLKKPLNQYTEGDKLQGSLPGAQ